MVVVAEHAPYPLEGTLLRAMFEARKRVFVDLLRWNVPVIDGRFEIDQFDDDQATYLIVADGERGAGRARSRVSPGATFERVYRGIKDRLRGGTVRPGEHIDPARLGDELASSVTPVRDALHRLVGERLVEAPRGDGFRAPFLTETDLRHLYGWSADLILLCLRAAGAEKSMTAASGALLMPDRLAERTETLFLALALRTGNPEHVAAVAHCNDRLHAARRVEAAIFPDAEEELDAIEAAASPPASAACRSLLVRYHKRRHRAAPEVLDLLRRAAA